MLTSSRHGRQVGCDTAPRRATAWTAGGRPGGLGARSGTCPSVWPGVAPHSADGERGTHAMIITLKSSQFHGSRRKVKACRQKPRARILTRDSKV